MKKIGYQGIEGSFSYLASLKYFGSKNKFFGFDSFLKTFKALSENKVDYIVIPIENSIAGSVYENYDLISRFKFKIIGEIYLKVIHSLLGIKSKIKGEKRIKLIKKVYSHPKALEQCQKFFEKHPWIEKIAYYDTAQSAKFVSEQKDLSVGAIANKICAKIFNLEVIKEKIQDEKNNFTRFFILSKKEEKINKPNKCSLIFNLPHIPGSLYRSLEVFTLNNINLTKIESRPIPEKPFEYKFFIDFEFKKDLKDIDKILNEFKKKVKDVLILGFYKKGKWIN